MEIAVVVGKRGVVTLPAKIRDALQVDEGDVLKIIVENQDELKIKILRG